MPHFTADLPGFYLVQLIVTETSVVHPLATPKSSLPVTVLIAGVNEAPIANAGPDQSVDVGRLVALDGSGSSDPDGDALTFAWSIISAPAGSAAALSDSTSLKPSFTADLVGDYVIELIVNDGFVESAPDTVTITADPVTAQNEPPVLSTIGNRTLPLGSSLAIQMTATDLNGDPLTFGANPLPLPSNAALDAMSGLFTFTPDETQVGDLVLTFSVSDGLLSDSESVTISVTGPQPGGLTALSGRLLDTNDYVNGIETPIVNAKVQLLGDTATAFSDGNGDFTLTGIPSGEQVFDIDTGTANPGPGQSAYAGFREQITLIADVENVISRPFFLPRIDPTGAIPVDPAQTTIVDNTNLGVKLEIAANSARDQFGNIFTGTVSISEVPDALAPAALPEELDPGLLITIQPVGVTFNPPALITFPNIDAMPAGSELDIWSLDPDQGIFTVVGTGQVSPDGSEITTIAGGVVAADWHLASGPQNNSAPTGPEPDNGDRCQCTEEPTGSSTHVNSGNLQEEHATVAYRSFDRLRNLTFRYNSTDADPQPILQMDATIPNRSAVPNSLSTRLRVGGLEVTEELHTSTQAPVPLSESQDETIHLAAQFDAGNFPTGSYDTSFIATNHFNSSSISTITPGRMLIKNQVLSPFGAGWSLAELDRLHIQEDGRVVLDKGDGGALVYIDLGKVLFGGEAQQIAPPASALPGALESDSIIQIFEERRIFALPQDIAYSANVRPVGTPLAGTARSLGAGTLVNSYLLHFDSTTGPLTLAGSITFPSEIIAVIHGDADLDATDGDLGAPGTAYPTGTANRGSEPTTNDVITLSGDLKTIDFQLQAPDGLAFDQLRILTAARTTDVLQNSTFDNDTENWSLPVGGSNLQFIATGGNPGGYARADEGGFGSTWYWGAPAKFLGDFSAAYGGVLRYDMWQVSTGSQFDNDDIRLDGAGIGLEYNFHYNPAVTWTGFHVPLEENSGWLVRGTGTAPTQAEFQAVLADITSLLIRGEYMNGGDRSALDNVSIQQLSAGGLVAGGFLSPPGDFSTLVQNPDDSFTRTLKDGTRYEFDAGGLLTEIVDRNGRTTSYGYDAQGALTTVTDPAGLVTTLVYGADGKLDSVTDPAGRVTAFDHDGSGNLISITDPDTSQRLFAYDAQHLLTTQTSKRGFDTTYSYNFAGRHIRSDRPDDSNRQVGPAETIGVIDPASGFGTAANPAPYTRPSDVVATYTDGNGNLLTYEINSFGADTDKLDAIGRQTLRQRDADNLVTQVTQTNGRIDAMTYDTAGNLLSRRQAVGTALERVTSFEYEPLFNLMTRTINPAGDDLVLLRDTKGNVTQSTDFAGVITSYAYGDPTCPGQVTQKTVAFGLPEARSRSFVYDPVTCNMTSTVDTLGGAVSFGYDGAGRVVSRTDEIDRSHRFFYDDMNRMVLHADPRNLNAIPQCGEFGVTCASYDPVGMVTQVRFAAGEEKTASHDEVGRLSNLLDNRSGSRSFAYDGNGNRISMSDSLGNLTSYAYDLSDRLIETIDPDLGQRLFAYDASDNLLSLTDARQKTTSYSYDLLNRQTGRLSPLNESETRQYDSRDNLIALTDAKSQTRNYSYDARSRLLELILPDDTVTFTYDAIEQLIGADDSDSSLTFTYDPIGRLLDSGTQGPSQPLTTFTKTRDAAGQVLTVSDGLAFDLSFGYNEIGKLSDVTLPDLSEIQFGYDGNGRESSTVFPGGLRSDRIFDLDGNLADLTYRVGALDILSLQRSYDDLGLLAGETEAVLQTSYQYDALHRLLTESSGAGTTSYGYDAEGNPTLSPDSQSFVIDDANRILEDDNFLYAYDANGNMISKTAKNGGAVTTFDYDSLDRLVAVTLPGGGNLSYRYDALGRRIERNADGVIRRYVYDGDKLVQEFDGGNNLLASFIHGLGRDRILAQVRGGQIYNYVTDALGSVRAITDSAGTVVNSYNYDAFGGSVQASETLPNLFRYVGRPFEPSLSLHDLRARWYDPALGRFLSPDPLDFAAGSSNLYSYAFNSPVNFQDPDGRQTATPLPSPLGPPIPLPDVFIPGTPGNDKFVEDTLDALDALSEAFGEAANDNEPGGQVIPFPEEAIADEEQAGNRHDSSTIFPQMPQLCRLFIDSGLYCAWICPDGEMIERTKGLTCPTGPCALFKIKTW